MPTTTTPTVSHRAAGSLLTGRKVLAIFVAFYATIACADGLLVTSALRTWSGLEEASPYQASQRFNAEIRLAREQTARGWRVDSAVERAGSDRASITVTLLASDGTPIAGKKVRAILERPTDKRGDRRAELFQVGPGRYAASVDLVAAGQWDLLLDVAGPDGTELRRRHRILLD